MDSYYSVSYVEFLPKKHNCKFRAYDSVKKAWNYREMNEYVKCYSDKLYYGNIAGWVHKVQSVC